MQARVGNAEMIADGEGGRGERRRRKEEVCKIRARGSREEVIQVGEDRGRERRKKGEVHKMKLQAGAKMTDRKRGDRRGEDRRAKRRKRRKKGGERAACKTRNEDRAPVKTHNLLLGRVATCIIVFLEFLYILYLYYIYSFFTIQVYLNKFLFTFVCSFFLILAFSCWLSERKKEVYVGGFFFFWGGN